MKGKKQITWCGDGGGGVGYVGLFLWAVVPALSASASFPV